MQHDEVIWQVINQGFCSFKVKTVKANFCKNKYNITGLCNRSSCPLANSRYATVLEENGICYLYMKTIERAHTPNKLWEKVKLPRNYASALQLIDSQLIYWPKFLIHKAKQRLTKIHQYLIRMRRLAKQVRPTIVGIHKKTERLEAKREAKALTASRITNAIKAELLARLKAGVYKDEDSITNVPESEFQKVVSDIAEPDLEDPDAQDEEDEEEKEEEGEPEIEFVEGYDELEDDDLEDIGDLDVGAEDDDDGDADSEKPTKQQKRKRDEPEPNSTKKPRAKARVEVQYENENENEIEQELSSLNN